MTKKRNTKTKLPGEQDIVHKFPIAKESRRINTRRDIRVLNDCGSPGLQEAGRYAIEVCCINLVDNEGAYAVIP